MDTLLSAVQWVVGKAVGPLADGVLEAWVATKNLGPNIVALRAELLRVMATLETASHKQVHGRAMQELLGNLRDSALSAEDLLDELDYFRIHDQLQGTYDAADQHAKGGVHDLALNARHTAKAVGKLSFMSSFCCSAPSPVGDPTEDARQRASCCAWPRARHRSRGNSSSTPNANQELTLCATPQRETPMLGFNRVDVSERMKHIVEQLRPAREEVIKILQSRDAITIQDIAQSRPITTCQSIEPNLYGRGHIMDTIIHDMTKGEYLSNDLTVLPIVGPGGIGKTTLIQHIYRNQQVKNHFQVVIWVCVSPSFNLKKLLEEIKTYIPRVEGEKDGRVEELIEQRIKSKRFLLVLDDIWEFSNGEDWKRLLLPLKTSQEKGSMILVTTRFPKITKMVGTAKHIELQGLESEEFRMLFLAYVFGNEPVENDKTFLLEIGNKIMEKLKGSPLAAKTVGTLLCKDLSLRHWNSVLESKEWETQTDDNDIMPALKLSYDHLSFQQQQCFSFSALFPEDHKYSATQLINLWIGLGILQHGAQNQTLEVIGWNNLKDLVACGFFREEDGDGCLCYVMHDLLHELALQVSSHECLIVHHSSERLEEIRPSIRHLSIIIDDVDRISLEDLNHQLRKLKTSLKVKELRTLMLFGEMDGSFVGSLGDLFREANALRVLHLDEMPFSVESILHNFSALVHLRYLCLRTQCKSKMHVLRTISKFYHLRILCLGLWCQNCHLPKELSNLVNMCHFYTPSDELHSGIFTVGKLRLLEELKVFRVNKESEGFEPSQLEHLTKLRELGIYNLENIHTKEEATKAKLEKKKYLERLTLDWDSNRSDAKPDVEAVVLESLQPYKYLEELCIRGHGGSSYPTWLSDELAVKSLHLSGVAWENLPPSRKLCRLIRLELVGLGSFGKWVPSQDAADHMFPVLQVLIIRDCPKLSDLPSSNHIFCPPNQELNIDWFPKLQILEIKKCPEFLLVAQIPWTETLRHVEITDVKLLEKFEYNPKSSYIELEIVGKGDRQRLDQVLVFNKLTGLRSLRLKNCPPLDLEHLLILTSLKTLKLERLDGLVGRSGGEGDVEWKHPVEHLVVGLESFGGPSGKDLTQLLTHLPSLSKLEISHCENIKEVAVGVDLQQTTSAKTSDGLLLLPAHLCGSLQELNMQCCPELVLVEPSSADPPAKGAGGGFQALQSLRRLQIWSCSKILYAQSSFPFCCLFPSSLHSLVLAHVKGMGTLEPLSNLTSLTELKLLHCGEDLGCEGLEPLLSTEGQLRELFVYDSPIFFDGWHPNLQDGGGEEQPQLVSSKLQLLGTDETTGLLTVPVCRFLSTSLTHLTLYGYDDKMECFTKDQEDTLPLLASLQQLEFSEFMKLQSLPAGLHKLKKLKLLRIDKCPDIRSLPKDGLPESLQELDVSNFCNMQLKQQCRRLVGTIPKIKLQPED